jgi:membrane-associated phospholipid phosphatase
VTARARWWRGLLVAPVVALITLIGALVATHHAGVPFRDPDHDAALYVVMVGLAVALLIGVDIAIRAGRRTGTWRPPLEAMRSVRRERWTARRWAAVYGGLVSFYVTYMAYRNVKAIVPLLRPGALFDHQLADLDRSLFGGSDPAVLLHNLLGTGFTTQIFSTFYVAFIVFLPLSLALALVFSREVQVSLFYAAALSINWLLGAVSYVLLPSLGPVYAEPSAFAALPHSEVTHLQSVLLDQRVAFLHDPVHATPQAIAAFASLHISMSLTAALAAHLLGLGRRVKIALWAWVAVTALGTVYLGWHYVIDDLAGVVIAVVALALARVLTGLDLRSERRLRGMVGVKGRPDAIRV